MIVKELIVRRENIHEAQSMKEFFECWLQDKPAHFKNYCFPDYSCCYVVDKTPQDDKELFIRFYEDKNNEGIAIMLNVFLDRLDKQITSKY